MLTTTRTGIRLALCLLLVAVIAAISATWTAPQTPAGATDAPPGAQPDPVLVPSTTPTPTSTFTFDAPLGEHCNGAAADGWRWHTFVVEDGVDLSTLNYSGAGLGVTGYVGADFDATDGTLRAPLHKGSEPTVNGSPAVSPAGQINPSDLGGFNFDPSVWTLVDGVYQVGFACVAPGDVLADQWWSNTVTIDADASSGTFLEVAEPATSEPATTTVALDADPDTATAGTEVTFTATVTPSTAAGSVEFLVDGEPRSTQTVAGGTATWATSDLTVGTRSITAEFTPDDTEAFRASTSEPLPYTVSAEGAQATSVTLTAEPEGQANVGEEVTLTATVEPSEAAGTVAFAADGFTLAAPVPVEAGVATLPTTDLEAGERLLTATFTPDDPEAFTESTGTLNYTVVGPAGEATTLTLTVDPSATTPAGEPVTLTATIDPPEATGTVVFTRITAEEQSDDEPDESTDTDADDESTDPENKDGSTDPEDEDESTDPEEEDLLTAASTQAEPAAVIELGDGAVALAEGTASMTISDLPLGEHQLQATFAPDDETAYQPSTSETVVLTVTEPSGPGGESPLPGDAVASSNQSASSPSGPNTGLLPRAGLGLGGVVIALLLIYTGRVASLLARPSNATTRR